MPASIRTIDFGEPEPSARGKRWEPGEHKNCKHVNLYHMHVKRPKKKPGK